MPLESECNIIWVYDGDHSKHPFIMNGIRTLVDYGYSVTIIDREGAPKAGTYQGISAFSTARANARYMRHVKRKKRIENMTTRIIGRLEMVPRDYGRRAWQRRTGMLSYRFLLFDYSRTQFLIKTLDAWVAQFKAFRQILSLRCDVIVATRPQSAIVGMLAAKARGKRFVYYPYELYGCQAGPYSRVLAWAERLILRCCIDELITQNEARAGVYQKRGARVPACIVHNYKPYLPISQTRRLRSLLAIPPTTAVVLYEGILTQGRWLDHLAQASLLLPKDVIVVLMGPTSRWWRQNAQTFLGEPLAKGKVVVAEAVPQEDLPHYVADADVGVIIYDDAVLNNFYCEPGKLSDYVFAGVPIVAPRFPTLAPTISQYGIGVCFDEGTPSAIAASVCAVLEGSKEKWKTALNEASLKLTWSTQAAHFVDAVVGTKAPPRTAHSGFSATTGFTRCGGHQHPGSAL